MKAIELRKMSNDELGEALSEAKEELFNLRFQIATNQLDNTTRMREVKKDIARLYTVIREQEIAEYHRQQTEGSA
jgi:large subunit ribosomal protein L29